MEERNLADRELDAEVRGMINRGLTIAAIKRLREATGWGLADAKTWVDRTLEHGTERKHRAGILCPYCEKPLRTVLAKRCSECGTDWHDASNIILRVKSEHG